jgi:hypothetical protein
MIGQSLRQWRNLPLRKRRKNAPSAFQYVDFRIPPLALPHSPSAIKEKERIVRAEKAASVLTGKWISNRALRKKHEWHETDSPQN